MRRSEKDTREQLIDPKLHQVGWELLLTKRTIQRNRACIEISVTGMQKTTDNPVGNGYVDYVLFGDDGKPLGLIEAKKSVNNEEQGRVQACLYADALEKKYGVRPIIYYTNGYVIKIIDGLYPPREVFGFHSKDELEHLIQRRNFILINKEPNPEICGRYYQKDAIEEIIKNYETKHSRSLIVLATGTGKTRVSCALSEILLRNNYVKRILFLADRKNLVIQAKEETFEKFLSTVPMATIIEGKKTGAEDARIVFSTYQSMLSIIKDIYICPFGIGHFDLIIVDEAHRSLFNKYADIFTYFDSLMLGLTATPRTDIHKSTYKVFNLDKEMPNYEYDLVRGVKDGYLTYFRALDRTPDILRNGLTYEDLSDEDKEQYEELFTEDDGTIPEKIEGKEFYSLITNTDTIRAVLRDLMDEGLKVNNGDTLGKTIIFARDHNHAVIIQEEFRKMYPELCIPNGANGVDYCVVIDNKIKYNEILQKEFKYKQDIRIVVSVDMMDTGVDIPEVVNLVFFKKILSRIKFWQMIGRGTRLCEDLKVISPSKMYFERQSNDITRQFFNSKQGFLVFDICNVFPFFKVNPDGRLDNSEKILSLNQKIYMEKVALYRAMQSNYSSLETYDRVFYTELRNNLINEIVSLNKNFIGVIKSMKYVDKYSNVSNWLDFSQNSFVEIMKYIAPNIQGEVSIESARFFDYLCFKFAATKLNKSKNFTKTAKAIYSLANYLLQTKSHINEISNHIKTLEYVKTNEFLNTTLINNIETVRIELRDLMRYIERDVFDPIISDFDDNISSTEDADDMDVDFTITMEDFKTYEEKVIFYIKSNLNNKLIINIQSLIKPSKSDLEEFKLNLKERIKDSHEFSSLFPSDEDIIYFIRRNIEINPKSIDEFISTQETKGFNEMQISYIKELFIFIFQNGKFSREDLLREELNFGNLFDSNQINNLILDIESVL